MGKYAKAIAGGLAALVGALAVVITGNETFTDVTVSEWLFVAAQVLAVYGVVYLVPNKPVEEPHKGKHQD